MERTGNLFGEFKWLIFMSCAKLMDYPLKLMEICLKTLGLFMAHYDEIQISVSSLVS
jgi:hypothetical protein